MKRFPRRRLPVQLTSFVGRRRQLTLLRSLVAGERMITLVGPAGVGKSRLALALAAEADRRFTDGVWLIELASLDEQTLVPSFIASALHAGDEGAIEPTAQIAAGFGNARALLVLDDCDHLLGGVARLCERLLRECPRLTIMATSRERLRVSGEVAWEVPPLDLPPAEAGSPARLAAVESVSLFLERGRQVRSDLVIDAGNAEAICEVVTRLEGMPLAIELAAAWSSVLSPAALLAGLGSQLQMLTGRGPTCSCRHQSLRAAIDASYALLDPAEARLFHRLGLFTAGWTMEAVAAVGELSPPEALRLLARLVDRSLVKPLHLPTGDTRYRMLTVLREYALEKLEAAGELEATTRAFAAHHLDLAERAAEHLDRASGPAWLERLDGEHDNCCAAIERMMAIDPAVALRLAAALGRYWAIRGRYGEGRHQLSAVVAARPEPGPALAAALRELASMSWDQGDQGEASELARRALAVSARLDDPAGMVLALLQLCQVSLEVGRVEEARAWAVEAVERAGGLASRGLLGLAYFRLGTVAWAEQRWQRAERLFTRSERLAAVCGDVEQRAVALSHLGRVHLRMGRLDDASVALRDSLALLADRGTPRQVALAIQCLAGEAVVHGDSRRAALLAAAADEMRQRAGIRATSPVQLELDSQVRHLLEDRHLADVVAEGRAMDAQAAVGHALGEHLRRRRPAGEPGPDRGRLTKREWQVAELLLEGMSNRDIALRLFLSERTVEAHLEHIRNKLGFRSRTQIAAWVTEHLHPVEARF
jgi:predicted ATPase/DNA-binding NarL/FixJ family response regulator